MDSTLIYDPFQHAHQVTFSPRLPTIKQEKKLVMHEKPDAELVALARVGDKNAFGFLMERYQHMTQRVAMGMIIVISNSNQLVYGSPLWHTVWI